jgi:signal transduction histidine kinase
MNTFRILLGRLVLDSLCTRLILVLLAGLGAAQLLSPPLIRENGHVPTGPMTDLVEVDIRAAVALIDGLPRDKRAAWMQRLARGAYRFLPVSGDSGPPVRDALSLRLLASIDNALAPDYKYSANTVSGSAEHFQVHLRLSDGAPLTIDVLPRPGLSRSPWLPYLLAARLALVAFTCWLAVRIATRPLHAVAEAADALGPDLRAVEMPERGPSEVVRAAQALNSMQRRIAAYVDQRLRILAAISHDLQTPITRMRLRLDLMDDPQWKRFDADLLQMQDLVREGLGYARAMHGKPEPVCLINLDRLVDSIAFDYRDDGAAVQWRGEIGTPVQTRPRALRRILCNLVDNALKYAGDAEIVLGYDEQRRVTIRVLDHGAGIPSAMLEAVFEPFYRLERPGNQDTAGNGLGLAIARQLATTLPARLTLHNRTVGGLEARLTLLAPRDEA